MTANDREVYATQPRLLRDQIDELLRAASPQPVRGDVVAAIVPDANLLSGGGVAADVYSTLKGSRYDTVILVEPSHGGAFGRIHVCEVDEYRTVMGNLRVDDQVRNELCDEDDDIFLSNAGHFHSQGIDVQLPFLQTVLESSFDVVPIVMGEETPDFCRELGQAIGEIMYSRRALLVATANVLEAGEDVVGTFRDLLENRDVSRLMALLNSGRFRMEGKGPVLVALIAAVHRRANHVQILDVKPPENGQPGYVGAVITRV